MKVIVHGGAGGEADEPEKRLNVLDEAAEKGAKQEDTVDAAEEAVKVLESSERFNAGVGGAVQSDGKIRTDAGIMTSTRDAGGACSMPGVEHAVSVARVVMEGTPHILISGDHAVDLAEDFGVETGQDLWTEKKREKWGELDEVPESRSQKEHLEWLRSKFGGSDTVGAVAYDEVAEEFCAATSTGGRWLALRGRVGDVPQLGSGFYASPAGGASATGAGEDIAKSTLSRRAVGYLEEGLSAQEAADRALDDFGELTGSGAGVILLDRKGRSGEAFNTDEMQTSVAEK